MEVAKDFVAVVGESENNDVIEEYHKHGFDLTNQFTRAVLNAIIQEDIKFSPVPYATPEEYVKYLDSIDPKNDLINLTVFFKEVRLTVNEQTFNTEFGEKLKTSVLQSLEYLQKDAKQRFAYPFNYASHDAQDYYGYRLIAHLRKIADVAYKAFHTVSVAGALIWGDVTTISKETINAASVSNMPATPLSREEKEELAKAVEERDQEEPKNEPKKGLLNKLRRK